MTRKAFGRILGAVLALVLVSVVPGIRADDVDEAIQITFQRPVRIPNRVLPAGTYLFRSVASLSDDYYGVVRIYNADGSVIYGTFQTKYAQRPDSTVATQLNLAQPTSKQQLLTLLSWFYPGSLTGHEFVYSHQQASRIAEEHQITLMVTSDTGAVSGRVMDTASSKAR
jgi:hypothetical protein